MTLSWDRRMLRSESLDDFNLLVQLVTIAVSFSMVITLHPKGAMKYTYVLCSESGSNC